MNLFKRQPKVKEITLNREYRFMYENFLLSTQQQLYVALEKRGDVISVLKFKYLQYKYGYPNDEAAHPYMEYGLGFYGFFEVHHSPWAKEISKQNSSHPNHSESLFSGYHHYIIKFKDVTLEVLADSYEELDITSSDIHNLVNRELNYLVDE